MQKYMVYLNFNERMPDEATWIGRYSEFFSNDPTFDTETRTASFETTVAPFRVVARVLTDGTVVHNQSYVDRNGHIAYFRD